MRKTKNALVLLLVVCLLLTNLPFPAALAAEGSCGDNATWTLNETTGTLVISGTGAINASAFRYWGNNPEALKIKNVYVSQGITGIGGGAFLNCENLKTISLPVSLTTVDLSAFGGCSRLTDVYYGGTAAQWGTINIEMNNGNLTGATRHYNSLQEPPVEPTPTPTPTPVPPTEYLIYEIQNGHVVITDCTSGVPAHVVIPDTIDGLPVTEIAAHAFQSDDKITKITIPASVTTMVFEPSACSIYYLPNLTAVEVAADNPNYCSINGVLYTKDMRTLLHFPAEWGAYYQIPDGVTKIAPRAFLYSIHLLSVSIPDSVTEIGNLAFSNCYWLTSITLPDGLSTISTSAFLTCVNLACIDIPKSVTLIEESAFLDCIKLKDIYYGGTEEDWQKVTIEKINDPLDNGRLKNATIHYSDPEPDPEPEPDPPEPPTPSGTAPTVVLRSSQIEGGQTSSVYFGNYYQSSIFGSTTEPVKWRVLSNDGGRLFLVSDQNLYEHEYATDCTDFTWASCSLRAWLNGTFLNSAFSAKEQAAIAATALENADNLYYQSPSGAGTTDQIFLLSIAEASNADYFPNDSSRIATDTAYAAYQSSSSVSSDQARGYWLRSRGGTVDSPAMVLSNGSVDVLGIWANNIRAVRPAFKLDLTDLLYASAAVNTEYPIGAMSKPGTNTANEWQLTLKDSSHSGFTATGGGTVEVGTSATVNYSNAKTGYNEYVSAIIADSGDNVLAYGRLAKNSASGTASVPIPADLAPGSYTLKVFSEQANGVKRTGYASDFVDLPLTVVEEGSLVDPHTHVFSTSWAKDGTGHWHECECGEKADVAGHTPVTDPAEEATCTAPGKTAGSHCSVCDYVITAQTETPAKGHSEVTDPAVEATCTAPGKTEGSHCSVCGYVITAQTETPAKGHSYSGEWSQDETNHWHACSVCQNKSGTAAHEEDAGTVTKQPTVEETGIKTYSCAVCHRELRTVTIAKLEPSHTHSYATAWSKNKTDHWHECECGDKADLAAHTPVTDQAVEATCTAPGKTEGSHCSVCGYVITAQTETPPKGHSEVSDPAVEATCTAPGKTEGSHCSVCGYVITAQTETPAKGHSDSDTWSQDEANHWHECSVCHEKTAQAPHAWNGGEVTTAPTATDAGVRTYTCTVCARTRTETVPATGGGSGSGGGSGGGNSSGGGGGGGSGSGSGGGGGSVSQKVPTPPPVEAVPEPVKLPFTDVGENDWYYDAVAFVYERGLLLGTAADKFAPHQSLTRGMAVTILYRLAGEPETNVSIPFTDVEDGSYYEKAVRWAYSQGIVAGRTQTGFAPDALLTRQELATLLHRYGGNAAATETLAAFRDGEQASDYARSALCWAVDRGIVSGRGNGILDPLGSSTRAEAAAMFMRYQKHVPSDP